MDIASERIARGCAQAAAGYAAAATAAYTELACRTLDFWSMALSGLCEPSTPPTAPAPPVAEPAFGLSPQDWNATSWLEPRRFDDVWSLNPVANPMGAFFGLANMVPLRGSSQSWGMAKVLIDSGVPRSVAWPTAEANAAVLDAADAASAKLRKIVATYHSESGHASAARILTPSALGLALTIATSVGRTLS